MCSRFRSIKDIEALVARYGIKQLRNFPYNPNVAITDTSPILRSSKSEGVKLEIAHFGLIPAWGNSPKDGARYYNARSETVDSLSVYSKAYQERRCIIPVLGFFEWDVTDPKNKIPYEVHRKDGAFLSLAGIWNFKEADNEKLFSFSIITGPPSNLTEPLHDRTPIILRDPEGWIEHGGKEHFQLPDDSELTISRRNKSMNSSKVKDPAITDQPPEAIETQLLI